MVLSKPILSQFLDSNQLAVQSQGFLSSKVDLNTDVLLGSSYKVNDHGVLYMDVIPTLKVTQNANLLLRLNLENTSFSGYQSATANYYVTAKIQNQFWKKFEKDSTDSWQLKAGDLNHQTIGQGLTIKDFETPGIEGSLQVNDLSLKVTTWAQDYDVVGDIFFALYLNTTFETPKWNSFSLFGKNELLLFFSEHSKIYDQYLNAIISFNPSSDYYWSGIRFSDSKQLKIEFLVTNNLINIDPTSKPYLRNPETFFNPRHQYKARFFPVEFLLIDLRAIWGINAT